MTGSRQDIDPRIRVKLELLRPTLPRNPRLASQTRKEFLAQAKALSSRVSAEDAGGNTGWINRFRIAYKEKTVMLHPRQRTAFYVMASLAAALVLLFGGAGMTAYASQAALPGDRLYSVKLAVEEAQVSLSRDTAGDAQLYLGFAERRLDEMAGLIAAGRVEDLGEAANRFQHDLQQSISGLRTLTAGDPAQGAALVSASAGTLARYAQILIGLLETAPQPAQPALKQAIQASQDSLGTWRVEFRGAVEAVGDFWIIDGKTVAITARTEIKDGVGLGDLVKVEALRADDGSLTAIEIEQVEVAANSGETEVEFSSADDDGYQDDDDSSQPEVEFTGQVQEILNGYWVVDGRTVYITGDTEIKDAIKQGDLVKVEAYESEDGALIAHEIEWVDDDDDDLDGNDDTDMDDIDDDDSYQFEDDDDQYEDGDDHQSVEDDSDDSDSQDDSNDSSNQGGGGGDSDDDHSDDDDHDDDDDGDDEDDPNDEDDDDD